MIEDPTTIASYAFAFRIGERVAISLVIIIVSLVVTRGFWRSIQKVDFSVGQGALTGGGTLVLATPVFALLALIGFAWVSFSHPVSVTVPVAAAVERADTGGGLSLMGATPDAPVARDGAYDRGEVTRHIQSLNCLAQLAGDAAGTREIDRLAMVKVTLMQPVWSADWGDAEAFSRWARGLSDAAPNPAARAVFEAVHPLC